MKKKIVSLALAVCLLAIAAVGTLAYFTDKTEVKENVFTVGNVDIDLQEKFEQNSKLVPSTSNRQDDPNVVEKNVWVENKGTEDAYVRVHIAIPAALDNGAELFDASKNILHWNVLEANKPTALKAGEAWTYSKDAEHVKDGGFCTDKAWNYYETEIDGVKYNVYVATYQKALKSGDKTLNAMDQVYLDKTVTNEMITTINEAIGNNWQIKVVAEGCQAAGFDDAFTALNTAFDAPSSTNNPFVA